MRLKLLSSSFKVFGRFILISLVALVSFQYYQIKFYKFPSPQSFAGEYFYNPYQNIKSQWLKSNFHAHAIAWNGLTNGAQRGAEVLEAYRQLGYDVPCLSDYFSINSEQEQTDPAFIPVYEHGINIDKSHRLSIGSQKVTFYDVSLFQNQSIKQYLIERLKENAPVVAIAHPTIRNSHPKSMLRYLSGYECLEVLNSSRVATAHWDAALSAGKPVWIIANDDCHDIGKHHKIAKCWTMINANSNHKDSVLSALTSGQSYGVRRLNDHLDRQQILSNTRDGKKNILKSLTVKNNVLEINLRRPAKEIKFIGQQGKVLHWVTYSRGTTYPITDQDTYVRAEVYDQDYQYYFNPIVRYNGQTIPANTMEAHMDVIPTMAFRFLIICADLVCLFFLYRRPVVNLIQAFGKTLTGKIYPNYT